MVASLALKVGWADRVPDIRCMAAQAADMMVAEALGNRVGSAVEDRRDMVQASPYFFR